MKTIKYILLAIACLLSISMGAQLHMNVGVVDIQDRMDGSTISWDVGYTQFFDRVGFGANVRYTGVMGDNYYTAELNLKQRVINEEVYRFDWGLGIGYNFDDYDVHPLATVRNSIRIDEGTWINIDFDNAYRQSKDFNGGGWRFETYLMFGISLDVTRVGQRNLKKIKRFY